MIRRSSFQILDRMRARFELLYGPEKTNACLERVSMLIGRYGIGLYGDDGYIYWDQADVFLITYADMVRSAEDPPLRTLHSFLKEHLAGAFNTVHLLPFFPYSSDDGFAIIDYRAVAPELGVWRDVEDLSKDFSLMFDLVLNHVSAGSEWFRHYTQNIAPERNFFIEATGEADLSMVSRPRTNPLLTRVKTKQGERDVWTTFSPDQIDLDFANPDVLFEFLDILMQYISHGARVIRLDAVAYLWKKIGTACIHLRETHEIVKLIRDFLEMVAPQVLILSETNVPHAENISYFGEGDEAKMVYQFSLPPLLLHALLKGKADTIAEWASNLETPPPGCTYLNFTASHDGIGVCPLEGLVPADEIDSLARHVEARGGYVSRKSNPDGSESPYELNITYFDALGLENDTSETHLARFLCSQTVALGLQGVPAVYFHSLTATPNWESGVAATGRKRSINRRKWDLEELHGLLEDEQSPTSLVFNEYVRLLRLRERFKSFHPDGSQQVFREDPRCFSILRTSPEGDEKLYCVSNFTSSQITCSLPGKLRPLIDTERLLDRISDQEIGDADKIELEPYQTRWIPLTSIAN